MDAGARIQPQTLLAVILEEYKFKLQSFDGIKKELNLRQKMILEEARKCIDELNEEANRLKMRVLREAHANTKR